MPGKTFQPRLVIGEGIEFYPSAGGDFIRAEDSAAKVLWKLDSKGLTTMNRGQIIDNPVETVASATSATLEAVRVQGSTITISGTTSITTAGGFNFFEFEQPTYSNASITVTNAATVKIDGAPATTGGMAITNAYGLWDASAQSRFDGLIVMSAAASRLVPGATSFSIRNTANAADNFIITNAGAATLTGTLTLTNGAITASAASAITVPANTAQTLRVTDGTTAIISVDSRNTVTGVSAVTITASNPTIAGAGGTTFSVLNVAAATIVDSTQTGVTALDGITAVFNAPTVNQSGGAVTITTASTVEITAGVTAGASVTITNNYALRVAAGNVIFGGVAPAAGTLMYTSGGGLQLGAPTGGDKGAGTINVATNAYLANTAYTNPDFVFEQFYRGAVTRFADNARRFAEFTGHAYEGLMPLDELRDYTRKFLHLPVITGGNDEGTGFVERFGWLQAALEEAHLYIMELHDRVHTLEAAAAA